MSDKFDARAALNKLNIILKKYDGESLELYSEQCYMEDIVFFLGKSISEEKYGGDAQGYSRFVSKKISPYASRIAKTIFTSRLKRGQS